MPEVVLLSFAENAPAGACGTGGGCGACALAGSRDPAGTTDPAGTDPARAADPAGTDPARAADPAGTDLARAADPAGCGPRTPVLACADALRADGATVRLVTVGSDADIDAVLAPLDAPPRPDGLRRPAADPPVRLVVATAADGQLRAVVRRLVRRYAPPPSRRPADLADDRTVPDLPPLGVLPLDPDADDLAARLGLPRDPAAVAAAVLGGRARRLDLLRNDGGSVTVDGALLGGADEAGRAVPWRGRVEVDDAVLSDGTEPILACAVGNGGRYASLDGLPLLTAADPTDGRVDVAVAVPVTVKRRWRTTRVRIEVRRARGRAVAVLPRDGEVRFLDDGVDGATTRKRSWWTEPGAWAVYAP